MPEIPNVTIQTIVARLEVLPPNIAFSSGIDGKAYSRDEMIEEVEQRSAVGVDFVNTEVAFLKALASGEFSKLIS